MTLNQKLASPSGTAVVVLTGAFLSARDIVAALLNHKGQHLAMTWERDCKTRKGATPVRKRVVAYVRTGIDYANLAQVRDGIASGERGEVQSIWNGKGEWVRFPFILRHVVTGAEYVRAYPSVFSNLKPRATYFRNGKECTLAEVAPDLLASELRDSQAADCFTVKACDVVSIGN